MDAWSRKARMACRTNDITLWSYQGQSRPGFANILVIDRTYHSLPISPNDILPNISVLKNVSFSAKSLMYGLPEPFIDIGSTGLLKSTLWIRQMMLLRSRR